MGIRHSTIMATHTRTHSLVQVIWSVDTSHWVESESLESRLVLVDMVVLLWAPGEQWRVWVLRRRFSRDCRKERRARSSSRGEEPSSSTSAISAKVTGWVLKRALRERRGWLRPLTTPLGTGSCCGNSSMVEAMRCAGRMGNPEEPRTIGRTAAITGMGSVYGTEACEKVQEEAKTPPEEER